MRRGQGAGLWRPAQEMLEDIAGLTSGRVISEDLGIKLEKVDLSQLGRAQRIVVDKEKELPWP